MVIFVDEKSSAIAEVVGRILTAHKWYFNIIDINRSALVCCVLCCVVFNVLSMHCRLLEGLKGKAAAAKADGEAKKEQPKDGEATGGDEHKAKAEAEHRVDVGAHDDDQDLLVGCLLVAGVC